MKVKLIVFLALFFVVIGLAACSPATAVTPTPEPTAAVSIETDNTVATEAPPAQDAATAKLIQQLNGAVLHYQKSGGIAGVDEQWMVYPDGRITGNDGTERQVTPEEVDKLLSDLETAGLFAIDSGYTSPAICCDQFTHVVIVVKGDQAVQFTAVDSDEAAPQAIWQSLEQLTTFLTESQ